MSLYSLIIIVDDYFCLHQTIAEQLQSSGGAEAEDDDDEKYNISEFTDGGFILTTTRVWVL